MLVASNRQTKAPESLITFVFLFIVIINTINTLELEAKKALIMPNFKQMVRLNEMKRKELEILNHRNEHRLGQL